MGARPVDIVSPAGDHVLPLQAAQLTSSPPVGFSDDKPASECSVMLLQVAQMVGVRDFASLATCWSA